jgi:hypothetical protein
MPVNSSVFSFSGLRSGGKMTVVKGKLLEYFLRCQGLETQKGRKPRSLSGFSRFLSSKHHKIDGLHSCAAGFHDYFDLDSGLA